MFRPSRRRTVAAGLLTTALTAGTVSIAQPVAAAPSPFDYPSSPQNDAFYTPPSPIPNVAPGTILRSREVTIRALGLNTPFAATQILYRSTDTKGNPNAVSGTVLLPLTASASPRPLIAYNVGSHGLGPTCAPSYKMRLGTDIEELSVASALAQGWAVVVTDYEGSGTPGPHTYAAGLATGQAVLDGARAALQLPAAGLTATSPIGIWGYSEGGLASTWAAEQATVYAPELNIKGVAAGGIPTDIGNVAAKIDGTTLFGFLLAASVGLNRAFPEMDLQSVLNDAGRTAAVQIASMCVEQWTPMYAFHRIDEYTTIPNAISLPQFQAVIAANRLSQRTPAGPFYIYESVNDEFVPVADVRNLVSTYCGNGVTVQYVEDLASEHVSLAGTGAPAAVLWLADRFAGKPAPSTC